LLRRLLRSLWEGHFEDGYVAVNRRGFTGRGLLQTTPANKTSTLSNSHDSGEDWLTVSTQVDEMNQI
jgi:hypothetical protein